MPAVLEENDGSHVDACPGKSASDASEFQSRQICLICSLPLYSIAAVCVYMREGIIGCKASNSQNAMYYT